MKHKCPYCGREFNDERKLINHYLFCKGRLRDRIANFLKRSRK